METNMTIIVKSDGELIDNLDFAEKWGIKYFDIKNGNIKCDFVGIILHYDEVLISFPKHYSYEKLKDDEVIPEIKRILSIIMKGESSLNEKKGTSSFPIDSYLSVQNYYKKYGLHFVTEKREKMGYGGRINWIKTIRKSTKIVQEYGVIHLPFVLVQNKNTRQFIAECMEYVLANSFLRFADFLDFLTPYKKLPTNPIFHNYDRCVKELKKIRNNYFKDMEKNLINALITYFEWESSKKSKFSIATNEFENYWESMIEVYLKYKFNGFQDDGAIKWKQEVDNKITNFYKPKQEYIESEKTRQQLLLSQKRIKNGYRIEFDHFYNNDENKEIYLFDSKYIYAEGFGEFNYKQAFYYYYLKQKYNDYRIFNGLIAPTTGKYETKVHVDRDMISYKEGGASFEIDKEYVDGLKIIEHYLNLKEVVEFSISRISDFKQTYLKNSK